MIRAAVRGDIPSIVRLHVEGFGQPTDEVAYPPPDLGFEELLFDDPTASDPSASFVWEQDGQVRGFVCVMPRHVSWRGTSIRAAVATKFLIARSAARPLIAAKLLRHLFRQSYDLLLSDAATTPMMRLWRAAGGDVLPFRSLDWRRDFRPAEHVRHRLAARSRAMRALCTVAKPVVAVTDYMLDRKGWNDLPPLEGLSVRSCLDPIELASVFNRMQAQHVTEFVLEPENLAWQLRVLNRLAGRGRSLRGLVVLQGGDSAIGAALYVHSPGQAARILKLQAIDERRTANVLAALCSHARGEGATGIEGYMRPELLEFLAANRGAILARNRWFLVRTLNGELLLDLERGCMAFDPLHGEWW